MVDAATEKGFGPGTKAGPILAWLKEDYDLGRGHGMALVHVITKGPTIDPKHVGSGGSHSDASDTLWLDGAATNPDRCQGRPTRDRVAGRRGRPRGTSPTGARRHGLEFFFATR